MGLPVADFRVAQRQKRKQGLPQEQVAVAGEEPVESDLQRASGYFGKRVTPVDIFPAKVLGRPENSSHVHDEFDQEKNENLHQKGAVERTREPEGDSKAQNERVREEKQGLRQPHVRRAGFQGKRLLEDLPGEVGGAARLVEGLLC